jgi:hypothetical protein
MSFIVICVLLFIYYSVVPHTAAFCRTLPHTAASTLPYVVYCYLFIVIRFIFSAAHCCTLRHAGEHCRMLFIVICVLLFIYYLFIIQCRTLPHIAAHCRTLLYVTINK